MPIKPEAILFDVGNVLLRLKTDEFLRAVEGACPALDRATMLAELRQEGSRHHAYEKGEITGEGFHAHMVSRFGMRWSYAEWLRQWNDYFLPNRPMEVFLAKLKSQARFWGLSNTNAEHYAYMRQNFRFFDAFEGVIGSHQVGLRKPDPRIYRAAAQKIGLPAGKILFIDDLQANVDAGLAEGMQAFRYAFNDLELKEFCKILGFVFAEWDSLPSSMAC